MLGAVHGLAGAQPERPSRLDPGATPDAKAPKRRQFSLDAPVMLRDNDFVTSVVACGRRSGDCLNRHVDGAFYFPA